MNLREEITYLSEARVSEGLKAQIAKELKEWAATNNVSLSKEAFDSLVKYEIDMLEGIVVHKRPGLLGKLFNNFKRF